MTCHRSLGHIAATALAAPCGGCPAGPGSPCAGPPGGMHLARFIRAAGERLITADDLSAVLAAAGDNPQYSTLIEAGP